MLGATTPLEATIREIGSDGRLIHLDRRSARSPEYAMPSTMTPPGVLDHLGLDSLWSHQALGYDHMTSGSSVVMATGTGSGKSLVYQLAIADAVMNKPGATALVIYPTKALAQNQLRSFSALGVPDIVAATHDGDSSPDQRLWVRRNANVILTNPEMLHLAILPNHQRWASFLSQLQYVVVDELHVLRGIFGTHVGHILRRLRRVAAHHGAKPTFAFASATIGGSDDLATDLIGSPVSLIDSDGSPQPEQLLALWDPTAAGDESANSSNTESAMLASEFVARDHPTLCFCRSRQGTEAITEQIRERLSDDQRELVSPYRGGYLPDERRDIEDRLFGGDLKCVVATSALELGIDIGDLDVAVVSGFPGTVASFRQQIGRVGRRDRTSLAILVAGSDQLDRWFVNHPAELLERTPERAVINPENPYVLRPHLACASHELPLHAIDDHQLWGDSLDDGVRDLALVDLVAIRNRRAMWTGSASPARQIGLRSGGREEVRIVNKRGTLIGTIDGDRAVSQVHRGARYVHKSQPWEILELDLAEGRAIATPDNRGPIRTHTRRSVTLEVLDEIAESDLGRCTLHLGHVEVSSAVISYQVKDRSGRVLLDEPLDLPASSLQTTAFWVTIPEDVTGLAKVGARKLPGALHAIEHCAIGVLPLFTICDRWDVGGVSIALHPQTGQPSIFIHDGMPGGAGVAPLGFDRAREIFTTAQTIIESCQCKSGCPGCIQSPKCGNGNEPLDKTGALDLLRTMVG